MILINKLIISMSVFLKINAFEFKNHIINMTYGIY